jgi:hypothetical protein
MLKTAFEEFSFNLRNIIFFIILLKKTNKKVNE